MHRMILLAATLTLVGCRGETPPPPMAGTPESTRATLATALDGWKQGNGYQDFAGQSPPLYFVDDDLNRGVKLLDYQIEGNGEVLGIAYSYVVTLTVQDKEASRNPTKKKVAYTVVTEPNLAVTREERKPS